jgi:hypothetical protein
MVDEFVKSKSKEDFIKNNLKNCINEFQNEKNMK